MEVLAPNLGQVEVDMDGRLTIDGEGGQCSEDDQEIEIGDLKVIVVEVRMEVEKRLDVVRFGCVIGKPVERVCFSQLVTPVVWGIKEGKGKDVMVVLL